MTAYFSDASLALHHGEAALIATIGPPGAGKTTWREQQLRHTPDAAVVSLDRNRSLASWCGCTANQAATPIAIEMAAATASTALAAGRTVIWDATNAEPASRALLQVLAAQHDARTVAVVLLPPLDVVLARNSRRDGRRCACGYARRVPEEVVRSMHHQIENDLPGLSGEGWHRPLGQQPTVFEEPA